MKRKKIFLSAAAFWACLPGLSAQEARTFDADSFKVAVTYMMPVSYPARMLSFDFSLEVRHDSAFVYLPYMGRVYQPVMNYDGLDFALPLKDFRSKTVSNSAKRVEFRLQKPPVFYKFTITAYDNGKADIILIPSNAQSITYSGNWDWGA